MESVRKLGMYPLTASKGGNLPVWVGYGNSLGASIPYIEPDDADLWGDDMTVCVACICDGNTILGAADKMLTAGDVQFQPDSSKIYKLTDSIALMVSGDMGIQAEVMDQLRRFINQRLHSDPPPDWFNVKDVAEWYQYYYAALKRGRAERELLMPMGLTIQTFLDKQATLAENTVKQLTTELINYWIPASGAIIAGIDLTGPHIYSVVDGRVVCHDAGGFASIGIGSNHASSQFMFMGYSAIAPLAKGLLAAFTAKKRAEVAPGVGAKTDMFVVAGLGKYDNIREEITEQFDGIYQRLVAGHAEADRRAEGESDDFIAEIVRRANERAAETSTVADGASPAPETTPPGHGGAESGADQ